MLKDRNRFWDPGSIASLLRGRAIAEVQVTRIGAQPSITFLFADGGVISLEALCVDPRSLKFELTANVLAEPF
jgi:hypothetical protein